MTSDPLYCALLSDAQCFAGSLADVSSNEFLEAMAQRMGHLKLLQKNDIVRLIYVYGTEHGEKNQKHMPYGIGRHTKNGGELVSIELTRLPSLLLSMLHLYLSKHNL